MKYWWVNHKQTSEKEINGGYIWSPKTNKDNSFNQTYENLKLVSRGDLIFSYAWSRIQAIGITLNSYQETEQPDEFGTIGRQWNNTGYLVKVSWTSIDNPLVPKEFIDEIVDLLPARYSPIQKNGNGNQKCYLASINDQLGNKLITKAREREAYILLPTAVELQRQKEDDEVHRIENLGISSLEKEQLIKARLGQGLFRKRLRLIEKKCRITNVNDATFLTASHIKPWHLCSDKEKIDGNNGLLLSPHLDRLFDRGLISFSNSGDLLIADDRTKEILDLWKVAITNFGPFNSIQEHYLEFHRNNIFLNYQTSKLPAGASYLLETQS